jgi:hypothetical protein
MSTYPTYYDYSNYFNYINPINPINPNNPNSQVSIPNIPIDFNTYLFNYMNSQNTNINKIIYPQNLTDPQNHTIDICTIDHHVENCICDEFMRAQHYNKEENESESDTETEAESDTETETETELESESESETESEIESDDEMITVNPEDINDIITEVVKNVISENFQTDFNKNSSVDNVDKKEKECECESESESESESEVEFDNKSPIDMQKVHSEICECDNCYTQRENYITTMKEDLDKKIKFQQDLKEKKEKERKERELIEKKKIMYDKLTNISKQYEEQDKKVCDLHNIINELYKSIYDETIKLNKLHKELQNITIDYNKL